MSMSLHHFSTFSVLVKNQHNLVSGFCFCELDRLNVRLAQAELECSCESRSLTSTTFDCELAFAKFCKSLRYGESQTGSFDSTSRCIVNLREVLEDVFLVYLGNTYTTCTCQLSDKGREYTTYLSATLTVNSAARCGPGRGSTLVVISMMSLEENLTALLKRLSRHCRIRPSSPYKLFDCGSPNLT